MYERSHGHVLRRIEDRIPKFLLGVSNGKTKYGMFKRRGDKNETKNKNLRERKDGILHAP